MKVEIAVRINESLRQPISSPMISSTTHTHAPRSAYPRAIVSAAPFHLPQLGAAGFFTKAAIALGIAITAVFAAVIGAVNFRAYQNADLSTLLAPPAGCVQPCWEGITTGLTTVDEAVAVLEAHPWIDDYAVTPGKISWWWNGEQPVYYDDTGRAFHGRMEYELLDGQERITGIIMQTTIALGDFQLALGEADFLTLYSLAADVNTQAGVVHIAEYPRSGLTVFNLLSCPMDLAAFWQSPSFIAFGDPHLAFEGRKINMKRYALPSGFFLDHSPICR